jgi:LemA protein
MEGSFTTWLIIALALALVGAFVRIFNRLVAARNACGNARGSIDANLKKRHDLIPNLVRVVRAYAAHERDTLERVSLARTRAAAELGSVSSPAREGELSRALLTLDARLEAYPELKASEEFARLSRVMTEIEEQISASRRAFNAHVMILNNLVQQFPTLIVARLAGLSAMDFFEAGGAARMAPDLRLPELDRG